MFFNGCVHGLASASRRQGMLAREFALMLGGECKGIEDEERIKEGGGG